MGKDEDQNRGGEKRERRERYRGGEISQMATEIWMDGKRKVK
jgi:hypothetical protein